MDISGEGADAAQNQKTSTGVCESWCFSKNYTSSTHADLRMPHIVVKLLKNVILNFCIHFILNLCK